MEGLRIAVKLLSLCMLIWPLFVIGKALMGGTILISLPLFLMLIVGICGIRLSMYLSREYY